MTDPTTTDSTPTRPEPASDTPQPYISPVLQNLDPAQRPEPWPACATCPASMWFTTDGELKAFCSRMHMLSWQAALPPVMQCDGRELALIALREAQEREQEQG